MFAFDPSMKLPDHNRTRLTRFYRMGLDSRDRAWDKDPDVPMRTLSSIYGQLAGIHGPDTVIDYLKVDIELYEWHVLPHLLATGMMDKVRQMNVDVHLDLAGSLDDLRRKAKIIKSIEDYGMVRFDSKKSPFGEYNFTAIGGMVAANNFEISWYNSRSLPYVKRDYFNASLANRYARKRPKTE